MTLPSKSRKVLVSVISMAIAPFAFIPERALGHSCFDGVMTTRDITQSILDLPPSAREELARQRTLNFVDAVRRSPGQFATPESLGVLIPDERSLLRIVQRLSQQVLIGTEAVEFQDTLQLFRGSRTALIDAVDQLTKALVPGLVSRTFRSDESQQDRRLRTADRVARCRAEAVECAIAAKRSLALYQSVATGLGEVMRRVESEVETNRLVRAELESQRKLMSPNVFKIAIESVESHIARLVSVQVMTAGVWDKLQSEFRLLQSEIQVVEVEIPQSLTLLVANGAPTYTLETRLTERERKIRNEREKKEAERIASETQAAEARIFAEIVAAQQRLETPGRFSRLVDIEIASHKDQRLKSMTADLRGGSLEDHLMNRRLAVWQFFRFGGLPREARLMPSQTLQLFRILEDFRPREPVRFRMIEWYPGGLDLLKRSQVIPRRDMHPRSLNDQALVALLLMVRTDLTMPVTQEVRSALARSFGRLTDIRDDDQTGEQPSPNSWAGAEFVLAFNRLLNQLPVQP